MPMGMSRGNERRDRDRGQLFLFDAPPARAARGEDLAAIFADLNRRFFAGRLRAEVVWSERMTSSAGNCHPREALIRISRAYHRRRPAALPVTIAHEMIHLVTPSHGPEFRRIGRPIAEALGVPWPRFRYAERFADPRRHRYVYACPRCGAEHASARRRRVSCGTCHPAGFSEEHLLVLTESRARPGPVLRGERPVSCP